MVHTIRMTKHVSKFLAIAGLSVLALLVVAVLPLFAHAQRLPQSQTEIDLSFAPLVREASPAVVNVFTERMVANLQHWGTALLEAATSPSGMRALAQLVRYAWLVLDAGHYGQFRAKLKQLAPDVEEAVMTILEELREEGRKEGLLAGEQKMLLKQLRHKFGEPTDAQIARVRQADEAHLGY